MKLEKYIEKLTNTMSKDCGKKKTISLMVHLTAPYNPVLQAVISPLLIPFLNQVTLCSDEPWVKESGTT